MQIEIKIDSNCREPVLIILTDRMTDEIHTIIKKLSDDTPQMLAGFREEAVEILDQSTIVRIYANAGKIYAVTGRGEFNIRLRLYELEERLDKSTFIRISNSEIINLKHAKKFDLNLARTICVSLSDGKTAYVSRRYVAKIKHLLGI